GCGRSISTRGPSLEAGGGRPAAADEAPGRAVPAPLMVFVAVASLTGKCGPSSRAAGGIGGSPRRTPPSRAELPRGRGDRSAQRIRPMHHPSRPFGIIAGLVSGEAIHQAPKRLGVGWERAKAWITSPDPAYLRKKLGPAKSH